VSISPVSDIVFDVAKAADPAKCRAASERLANNGAASPAQSGSFAFTLNSAIAGVPDASSLSASAASKQPQQRNPGTIAHKGLEQLVWKTLVESMLPKDSPVLFGSGTAGDIWRSMLADQLAAGIGNAVDLGSFRPQIIASRSSAQSGKADRSVSLSSLEHRLRSET
jgi:peptidoglycan hydrolase FlgJ